MMPIFESLKSWMMFRHPRVLGRQVCAGDAPSKPRFARSRLSTNALLCGEGRGNVSESVVVGWIRHEETVEPCARIIENHHFPPEPVLNEHDRSLLKPASVSAELRRDPRAE